MPDSTSNSDSDAAWAIVCQTVPPYRRHLHHRLAREIPELRLVTINTHQDETRDWHVDQDDAIGLVNLPEPTSPPRTSGLGRILARLGDQWQHWSQGRQAIDLLSRQPTAAVVINGYNDLGRLRLIRWCRRQGVPSFIWADSNVCSEPALPGWKQWLKRRYIGWVSRRVTGFFGCGRYGVEYWKRYGVEPERIFVAPYEPDYSLVTNLPQSLLDEVAAELDFSSDRRRLLFCGRLVPAKRPDLLIDAFASIAAERPNWDLVMLGDGPLKQSLQAQLPAELADRVRWIPFDNRQERVSAIYRLSDVLVLPSDYEPWALVINEAAAAGLAMVATDVVGAAAELVADGENGRLVPPGDASALTQALREVTAAESIDRMRAASATQLAAWRREGDPVAGYRQALEYAGVLAE